MEENNYDQLRLRSMKSVSLVLVVGFYLVFVFFPGCIFHLEISKTVTACKYEKFTQTSSIGKHAVGEKHEKCFQPLVVVTFVPWPSPHPLPSVESYFLDNEVS